MMNSSRKTGQSRSTLKLIKVFVSIIAVALLTLQPVAPSYAFGPGPDPGPDLGPGR